MKLIILSIILVFFQACSSMKCYKFGTIKYCSPKLKYSINEDLNKIKTTQEKKLVYDGYIRDSQLTKLWNKTILNISKFIIDNNGTLYSTIVPIGQGFYGKEKEKITLIQKDDNINIELSDEFKREIIFYEIIAKIQNKINPMKILLKDLIKSKKLIANELNIIVNINYISKLLSKYYLSNKLNAYITKKDIPPHIDYKGNLYLNSKFINKPTYLRLILIHEAFHLLPITMENQYLSTIFFNAFSSEKFAKDNIYSYINTKKSYNLEKVKTVAINPIMFYPILHKIISDILQNEFITDIRVLSYIKNSHKECISYLNLLKNENVQNSKITSQKSRIHLIEDTCKYMKYYDFTFLTPNNRLDSKKEIDILVNKVIKNNNENIIEEISTKLSQINYKNLYEQKIMKKWYKEYFRNILKVLKSIDTKKIYTIPEMQIELSKILHKELK
jgi:hypothetical protein